MELAVGLPFTVVAFVVLPLLIRLLSSLALPTNGSARTSPESMSWVPSIFIADIPAAWPAEPWRIFIFDNEPLWEISLYEPTASLYVV